jgi:hypothetical protein
MVVKAGKVHASIGPQGLVKGNAVLRASAPASVKRIRVTVYNAYGQPAWSHMYSGHSLTLPLEVTNKSCGCTYDTRARIVITALGGCFAVSKTLVYNNQDPLRKPKRPPLSRQPQIDGGGVRVRLQMQNPDPVNWARPR